MRLNVARESIQVGAVDREGEREKWKVKVRRIVLEQMIAEVVKSTKVNSWPNSG